MCHIRSTCSHVGWGGVGLGVGQLAVLAGDRRPRRSGYCGVGGVMSFEALFIPTTGLAVKQHLGVRSAGWITGGPRVEDPDQLIKRVDYIGGQRKAMNLQCTLTNTGPGSASKIRHGRQRSTGGVPQTSFLAPTPFTT
ncbi:unnamed protein product [Boreogadus saida]